MSILELHTLGKIKTFGNSMFPLLINGDVVYFQKTHFKDINVNDIIIFKQRSRYITHRVIYKTDTYLIPKGDNNLKADGKVYKKDIIGTLEKVKRGKIEFHPELFYHLQSSFYLKEIKHIVTLFKKYKIEYLFLKGLPVHLKYEKKIPRRLYADSDILIHIKDLYKVKKLLLTLGYKPGEGNLNKNKQADFGELNFYKKIKNVVVVFDVHVEPVFMMTQINLTKELYSQSLMQALTVNFLQQKNDILLDKATYHILKPAHLVLYLCLHFFHHNFKGAFRLSFIHTIISKENNTEMWKEFVGFSKRYRLENFIYPVLLLLKNYYKTRIPNEVVKQLEPCNYIQVKIGEYFVSDQFFNDESRLFGGLNRLLLLLSLSSNPVYKKLLLLVNKEIWYLVIVILGKIGLFILNKPKRSLR